MKRPLTFEQFERREMLSIGPPVADPALTMEFWNTPLVSVDGTVTTAPEFSFGESVNVLVNPVPDYTANEDEVLVVSAALGVSGGLPGVVWVAGPTHGVVMLDDDGAFILAPDPDWFGLDGFLHSRDGVTSLATILVLNVNDPPDAVDDQVNAVEDIPRAIDVLANDIDPDPGDVLSIDSFTQPASGVVTHDAGILTYVPSLNFFGTDTFEYTASDGEGGTDTATVTVEVAAVNDAPVAVPDAYSLRVNRALSVNSAEGPLANDYDPDGNELSGASVTVQPTRGRLTVNGGAFLYIPNPEYVGEDSFEYKAFDGELWSESALVTIDIIASNDPTVRSDVYISGPDGISVDAAAGVLANDRSGTGADLTAVLVIDPLHGTMVMESDGSFTYTPHEGYTGADPFVYDAIDGLFSSRVQSAFWVEAAPAADMPLPVLGKAKEVREVPALGSGSIYDVALFSLQLAEKRAWLDGPILAEAVDAVLQQGV